MEKLSSHARAALFISMLPICFFILLFVSQGNVFSTNDVRTLLASPFSCNKASDVSQTSNKLASWQAAPVIRDYEPLGVEFTDEPWWEQRDSNRTIYVATQCGTGNLLEVLASSLTMSYKENINFKFVFVREWFGPATWDDLFSFPKVNFDHTFPDGVYDFVLSKACKVFMQFKDWKNNFKKIEWSMEPDGSGEFACLRVGWWKEPPFAQNSVWFYRILRPANDIQLRIDAFKKSQEWNKYQWVGVHVRITDNVGTIKWLLENVTPQSGNGVINTTIADDILPLEHYITLMRNFKDNYPVHNLSNFQVVKPLRFFLATDKDETRSKIQDAFPENQIVYYNHGISSNELRSKHWGMKLAVIDMFLLASCQVFIGTPFSTFSEAAHYIGGNVILEPNFAYQKQSQ
eukprot:g1627.t1